MTSGADGSPFPPLISPHQCTFFCVTCQSTKALCHQCLADHEGHHILQVRRYVYEDVVNTSDMKELINMEGIQVIISAGLLSLFLSPHPWMLFIHE